MCHSFSQSHSNESNPNFASVPTTTTTTRGIPPPPLARNATMKRRHGRVICTISCIIFLCFVNFTSYWDIRTIQKDMHQIVFQIVTAQQQTIISTFENQETSSQQKEQEASLQQKEQLQQLLQKRPGRRKIVKRKSRTQSSAPQPLMNRTITILLHFKGEIGNHLSVIAGAYVTKYKIEKKYPYISIQFIGQHQDNNKWIRAMNDIRKCFPKIYEMFPIYDGGIYDPINFNVVAQQQKAWLDSRQARLLRNVHDDSNIDLLHRLLQYQQQGRAPRLAEQSSSSSSIQSNSTDVGKYHYSLPYLIADEFYWTPLLKDIELYNIIRQFFIMNETECCGISEPQPNDIIYYHRNFKHEFSNKELIKSNTVFQEVTPYTASHYLFFNHTIPIDQNDGMDDSSLNDIKRVAILGRSLVGLEDYQQAFNETNHLPSYIVHNTVSESPNVDKTGSGMVDFCFIMKSRDDNEIIGKLHSTFIEWSSFLSNSSKVRLYTINDTPIEKFDALDYDGDNTSALLTSLPWSPSRMKVMDHIVIDDRQFIFEEYWQPYEP